jgi:hypothetical protein
MLTGSFEVPLNLTGTSANSTDCLIAARIFHVSVTGQYFEFSVGR